MASLLHTHTTHAHIYKYTHILLVGCEAALYNRRRVFKVKIIMLFINIRFISRRVTNRIVCVTICRPDTRRPKIELKKII